MSKNYVLIWICRIAIIYLLCFMNLYTCLEIYLTHIVSYIFRIIVWPYQIQICIVSVICNLSMHHRQNYWTIITILGLMEMDILTIMKQSMKLHACKEWVFFCQLLYGFDIDALFVKAMTLIAKLSGNHSWVVSHQLAFFWLIHFYILWLIYNSFSKWLLQHSKQICFDFACMLFLGQNYNLVS